MKPLSQLKIPVSRDTIVQFCQRNHIDKFSFFGSVLRPDFRAESDVDVLVEFHPDHIPGLISIARMEQELSELLERKVDLRTPEDISHYFRQQVLDSAVLQYVYSG
jgi:predicted nucleotidyltransferase